MTSSDATDFAKLERDAQAYAERVLPHFVGEAREEVETILEVITGDLESIKLRVRKSRQVNPLDIPYDVQILFEPVEAAVQNLDELIPDLHSYGVEDTEPLEQIREALKDWIAYNPSNFPSEGPASAPV